MKQYRIKNEVRDYVSLNLETPLCQTEAQSNMYAPPGVAFVNLQQQGLRQ